MTASASTLLQRYGTRSVPRYTSYPTANVWGPRDQAFARTALAQAGERPLSLYVHVPFCHRLCFFCGCNREIVHRRGVVARYLDALELEFARVRAAVPRVGEVVQVHLGGGTPTFLDDTELTRLIEALRRTFPFDARAELGIEVHPSVTSFAQLDALAGLGFNRLSLGVQDFDPVVQARINRPQPFEQTRALIDHARARGFGSINVDVMYGLPAQTPDRFARTLDQVAQLRPERLAVFGYAHLPRAMPHQRLLEGPDLPGPAERLALLQQALAALKAQGYVSIGLDHFALPGDPLAVARADGTLQRNFMGYTTCAESDLLGFGPSAISEVGGAFIANLRATRDWAARLESGALPVDRGWLLTPDDQRRAEVIQRLFCRLEVDLNDFAARHRLPFDAVFPEACHALEPLIADGLVTLTPERLQVTTEGQLFLRNVAAVFDGHLPGPERRRHAAAV